jgi:hypothetical protein
MYNHEFDFIITEQIDEDAFYRITNENLQE